MNAIFLRVPDLYSLELVVSELHRLGFQVEEATANRFRIDKGGDHAWLFLEREPAEVPVTLPREAGEAGPLPAIVIEYYSVNFVRLVLQAFANGPEAWVDNDHGTTLLWRDFVSLMDNDPKWDWRQGPPTGAGP